MQNHQTNQSKGPEVVYDEQNVVDVTFQLLSNSDKVDFIGDYNTPIIIFEAYKRLSPELKKGISSLRLRLLTDVNKDNIAYCKGLMKFTQEIHHLDGIKANFAVSNTEYFSVLTQRDAQQQSSIRSHIIYSNVKGILEQQQYLFKNLWDRSIPATQKIKELEEGIQAEFFEVVDSEKISQILVDLTKSAKNEMLLLLPNDRAMVRVNKLGVFEDLLNVSKIKGVTVKIICPISDLNSPVVEWIADNAPEIKMLNGNNSQHGICIVDRERFLRVELVKPEAESFEETVGFAIYSNNKRSANLYRWMFELLWNERMLNEESIRANNMQKEFVNIAAHELRSPAQSIVGYTELLMTDPRYIEIDKEEKFIEAIHRNSVRLGKLTKDILDVTRIENQTFTLHKQRFCLNEIVSIVVQDVQRQNRGARRIQIDGKRTKKISAFYELVRSGENEEKEQHDDKDIFVNADREKIIQVLTNILDNAFKFTQEEDQISITVQVRRNEENDTKETMVSIKNTGSSIDVKILPKLFTKFSTKSISGTGLGLYISKNIIEEHGGKIWAENNMYEKGSTFVFTIPVVE